MNEPTIEDLIRHRFAQAPEVPESLNGNSGLKRIIGRGSCRRFRQTPVALEVLETLAAASLSAPSKSDLQQCDILLLTEPDRISHIKALLTKQTWIESAPSLVIFLANNRRQRQLQDWRGQPFTSDNLDVFFNASVDAAIGLAFFIAAAEAAGLGCCPISAIRNFLPQVRDILELPDHVFPVVGLGVGYPVDSAPTISARLPLSRTVHHDRFVDITQAEIAAYDNRRAGLRESRQQHDAATGAGDSTPLWSEAKARMSAKPHRPDFAPFILDIGFKLD